MKTPKLLPAEVACQQAVAVSSHRQGLVSVQPLGAGMEINARVGVEHPEGDVHGKPADLVDHGLEAPEGRDRPIIDMHAEARLDRLDHQIRAAGGQRTVDLVAAVAGDVHPRIPRDAHHGRVVLIGVQEDQVQRIRE